MLNKILLSTMIILGSSTLAFAEPTHESKAPSRSNLLLINFMANHNKKDNLTKEVEKSGNPMAVEYTRESIDGSRKSEDAFNDWTKRFNEKNKEAYAR